jgi:histidinol phosphatase-like PHP family hydrolase
LAGRSTRGSPPSRAPRATRGPFRPPPPRPDDPNLALAGLLFDLAAVQTSEGSRAGYKRAARTLAALTDPITDFIDRPSPQKIPNIGPSSLRVIAEYLADGRSPTVDHAVAHSGRRAEVARMRELRAHFLSRAVVERVLRDASIEAVRREDYRGDFQMHSVWSDGALDVAALARACVDRGYSCACLTDHSYGLPIAGGVSMPNLRRQHAQIDRVNAAHRGSFRLFKGIETNILADGSVDMTIDERRRLELVVAAPHSLLRRKEDQTPRMLRAVRERGVHILGHPQGRKYGQRSGVQAAWPDVFAAAAESGVAIEIDGSWDRQDVHVELARAALEAGCLFALDSDAHDEHELPFADIALAHARLAGIPAERVINTWSDDDLMAWAAAAWNR